MIHIPSGADTFEEFLHFLKTFFYLRRFFGKCTETFDLPAAIASGADNSCFARVRYTFLKKSYYILYALKKNSLSLILFVIVFRSK